MESGIYNLESRIWNLGSGIWNLEPWFWKLDHDAARAVFAASGGLFCVPIRTRRGQRCRQDRAEFRCFAEQGLVFGDASLIHKFEPTRRFIDFLNRDTEL